MKGLVLLSSGGQFCYAYDKMSDLVGSEIWRTCTYAKQFGCCPSNLTVRPRCVTMSAAVVVWSAFDSMPVAVMISTAVLIDCQWCMMTLSLAVAGPGSAVAALAPDLSGSCCGAGGVLLAEPEGLPAAPADAAGPARDGLQRRHGRGAVLSRGDADARRQQRVRISHPRPVFRSRGWERGRYQSLTLPRPPAPT